MVQLNKFKAVYNDAIRIIFGYRKFDSVRHVITDNCLMNYAELLRATLESLQIRLSVSDNLVLRTLYLSSCNYLVVSRLTNNLAHLEDQQVCLNPNVS